MGVGFLFHIPAQTLKRLELFEMNSKNMDKTLWRFI